jgi:hypothetical protein
MKETTDDDLKKILGKWQPRLGLSDWDISVSFRDARDMDQHPAKSHIQGALQRVDIRIMACNDRQACDPCDGDPELDLVHELVHIRLWAIDPPAEAERILHMCREQAIEWIARALVALDRRDIHSIEWNTGPLPSTGTYVLRHQAAGVFWGTPKVGSFTEMDLLNKWNTCEKVPYQWIGPLPEEGSIL